MEKPLIGHQIVFLESVDSTNDYAYKEFKSGAIDSGTVIVAAYQTAGKGQRGKTWQAESESSLLVSITADLDLWEIKKLISLNHIVALSIQNFLLQHTPDVYIKWPNDIMVSDKKIAGILIETQMSSTYKKAVIGFGININQTSFEAPRATSLFLETHKKYDPKEFIPKIIEVFNALIKEYQLKGEDYFYQKYNGQLWKLNQIHPFEVNGVEKRGKISSTTIEGQLIVRHADEEHCYSNGEVKY